MAGLFYIFALACLGLFLDNSDIKSASILLYSLDKYFPFYNFALIGPFVYLFVRVELDNKYEFTQKEWTYFLFALWSLIPSILLLFENSFKESLSPAVLSWLVGTNAFIAKHGDLGLWLVTSTYLVLALGVYHRHKGAPKANWMKHFLNFFLAFQFAMWLPILVIKVSPFSMLIEEFGLRYYFIYAPLTLIVYWVALKWVFNSPTLTFKSKAKTHLENTSSDLISRCIKSLEEKMTNERLYLDKDISLTKLANSIGAKKETLYYILHQELGIGFSDFVNRYRVDAAAHELLGMIYSKQEVEKIGLKYGFKTLQDFQSAFQSFRDVSIKDFIKKSSANSKVQVLVD